MASRTSLTYAPAALATARIRSIDHDGAANRRAPVIGTLSMLRGAWPGSTTLLSSRPRCTVRNAVGVSPTRAATPRAAAIGRPNGLPPDDLDGRRLRGTQNDSAVRS